MLSDLSAYKEIPFNKLIKFDMKTAKLLLPGN